MNICISLLLFVCAEGFAPLARTRNKDARSNLREDVSVLTSSYHKPIIIFAVSGDSNESDDTSVSADMDDYDFERGFQERLKKEGGETGVKVKAAKRSVDAASKQVTNQAKRSMNTATAATKGASDSLLSDLGLLSKSEWGLTLGALALVVVLAIGTQVASPQKSFADMSTKDQIERLNRAREGPTVTENGYTIY
uniref:Uncharacterized protein n=1 Tax=Skeletonema marinoi TaxID=267567 RepID=A0A7S2M5X2_9STRA|mmetsp:Transcript_535/g.837  ORF Transcript_535/g.837 Transcript_535/m.837 type:complete len:195 (+) Transcript_535:87-671(+)